MPANIPQLKVPSSGQNRQDRQNQKIRLDQFLVTHGFYATREKAQAAIMAGEIWLENQRLEKPSCLVANQARIQRRADRRVYVGRGGEKLDHALTAFGISVANKVCMDIGASTGGFSHRLLVGGASHVFCVDVGFGQLDSSLRTNPNITVVERTNARYLRLDVLRARSTLADKIGLITMDVSFISCLKIIEPLSREFSFVRQWIILFKPQFEVGRKYVKQGGVIRDYDAAKSALEMFTHQTTLLGFHRHQGPFACPIAGKKSGNIEYFFTMELGFDHENPSIMRTATTD